MTTCCFTGHRPQLFPWGENISDLRAKALIAELERQIQFVISEGVTRFICGGALGVDTWTAEIVLNERKTNDTIKLTIAKPYAGHNANVSESSFVNTIQQADEVVIVSNKRGIRAFAERDRYMAYNRCADSSI